MRLQARLLTQILVLVGVLLQACSWDSAQRTGYESVETLRQRQCMQQPDRDCPDSRIRYEQYQSERERLQYQEH
jgi:hypothetical protein